ncbi:uncharacterized protein LOC126456214 [Schistocerca serialis cubense]|uniref:uncharacterized protein LOC126456214 n=1 Tax=Schistocerca serialis cubense TaxID=2023355 RepID=UPI00214EF163|nr:uncharacterized protein LOC126456214 [Schistocerca serialis cubense]
MVRALQEILARSPHPLPRPPVHWRPTTSHTWLQNHSAYLLIESKAQSQCTKILSDSSVPISYISGSSPLHMVKKKNGAWCLRDGCWSLNGCTIPDRYPVPNEMDSNSNVAGPCTFSVIERAKSFSQITIARRVKHETPITLLFGLIKHNTMLFDLHNTAQTPKNFMRVVFDRLQSFGIVINLEKFFSGKITRSQKLESHSFQKNDIQVLSLTQAFKGLCAQLLQAMKLALANATLLLTACDGIVHCLLLSIGVLWPPTKNRLFHPKCIQDPSSMVLHLGLLHLQGSVKPLLSPACKGPFKVLSHSDKTFVFDIHGRKETVSTV